MSNSRLGMLVSQDLIDDLNKLFPDTCIKCSGQLIPDTRLSFSSVTAGANPSLN
jgi:hypothetical protein